MAVAVVMPSPFIALVLVLAAYRLTRLAGWDDFPLAVKIRAWVIGERRISPPAEYDAEGLVPIETEPLLGASQFPRPRMQEIGRSGDDPLLAAAYTPEEYREMLEMPERPEHRSWPVYTRPTLAHMVFCPFCIGWWISLATWVAWLCWHPVEYGLMPFAISGAVGLIAKQLDP